MKLSTKVIHVGNEADPRTGAIMPPIYMTSTFVQEAPGEAKGYEYTRANNPNFEVLEKLLASLEEAQHATVFSSGLGALTAMISGLLSAGDHVVGVEGLYGGTYRLFNQVFNRFGIKFTNYRNIQSMDELDRIISQKPKWMLFETPTNPLLEIIDIAALTTIAKRHGVLSIVDNTFATPYNQSPLQLGADVVWHSTTKYIGGHSDVIGGAIITNSAHIKERVDFARKAVGLNPSPFDAWLVNRGVKTLAVRMKQHESNGMAVARFLSKHPKVAKVYYPGLETHVNHAIAKKQMRGFGGMVSVEFKLSLEETKKLISSFKLFSLAESLGGVESLVNHPATMTHASIPRDERIRLGISDGLVRLSVGIEDIDDLLEDLRNALDRY
jgi:cystathionine beta-lyase/cystathionine gamma-synthase